MLSKNVKTLCSVFLSWTFFAVSPLVSASQPEPAREYELVWAENNANVSRILYSRKNVDEWQLPTVLISADSFIGTPSLVRQANGRAILVWSQGTKRGSILKFSIELSDGSWSLPSTISDLGKENLASHMIRDPKGGIWLFWCSDDGQDADIYMRKATAKLTWSAATRVHPKNEVPDLNPQPYVGSNGDVYVRWQYFSWISNSYDFAYQRFGLDGQQATDVGEIPVGLKQSMTMETLGTNLPNFLPTDASSFLYINDQSFNNGYRVANPR